MSVTKRPAPMHWPKSKPAKDARPVLLMVSQSCSVPEAPAEAVLRMRLAPWFPAPAVSCVTIMSVEMSSLSFVCLPKDINER